MVKRAALMESLSSNLNDFLKKTSKNLSLPDKKFLRDDLIGLLRAGQPIVCQMAAMHSAFLSQCVYRGAERQGQGSCCDAQGNSRTGRQSRSLQESRGSRSKAGRYEAQRGRCDCARRRCGDVELLCLPGRALASDTDQQPAGAIDA